jgi:hypothetical protein
MILVFDQGATERRTFALTLDVGDTLVGATARLVATTPNGTKILDANLSVSVDTALATLEVLPDVSSAWVLNSWGSTVVVASEGAKIGRGPRVDFQIEVLLANGDVRRVDLGASEDFIVVTPELVR